MKINKIPIIILICISILSCKNSNNLPSKIYPRANEIGETVLDITYCNYETEEYIEEDATMEEAISYFRALVRDYESFLTIGFNNTQVIQFVWEKNGKCLAEITNDGDERIYMQRYASTEECIDMIRYTYTGDPNTLPGFLPVPIMDKTLDEVLREQ